MINTASLVKRLKPLDPEKIILFGSAVRGGIKPESDIDLLIIKKTKKRPVDRVAEALSLVWGSIPHVEMQVLTPGEFDQAVEENRFFITQEVIKRGRIIYEKKD